MTIIALITIKCSSLQLSSEISVMHSFYQFGTSRKEHSIKGDRPLCIVCTECKLFNIPTRVMTIARLFAVLLLLAAR